PPILNFWPKWGRSKNLASFYAARRVVCFSQLRASRCASAISRGVISSEISARQALLSSCPDNEARLNHLCASTRSISAPSDPVEYITPRSKHAFTLPFSASASRLSIKKAALFMLLPISSSPCFCRAALGTGTTSQQTVEKKVNGIRGIIAGRTKKTPKSDIFYG